MLPIAAMLWSALVAAQPRTITYEATERGVTTRIALRVDGTRIEGGMQEGTIALGLRGTLTGQRFSGGLLDPASGREVLPITGELRGDRGRGSCITRGEQCRAFARRRCAR
jgi:hypothetical protein